MDTSSLSLSGVGLTTISDLVAFSINPASKPCLLRLLAQLSLETMAETMSDNRSSCVPALPPPTKEEVVASATEWVDDVYGDFADALASQIRTEALMSRSLLTMSFDFNAPQAQKET